MSFFTQQFENKPINIASCIPCALEDGDGIKIENIVVTSYVSAREERIFIYSLNMSTKLLDVSKEDLLKAIQQTPVYGKVDD